MKKNILKKWIREETCIKTVFAAAFIFISAQSFALEPNQILIIANSDVNDSVRLAEYYCQKRDVPFKNILKMPLGKNLPEEISRQAYNDTLGFVVRSEIKKRRPYEIKCLLTIYGVPIKVGQAPPLKNAQQLIAELSKLVSRQEEDFKKVCEKMKNLGRKEMIAADVSPQKTFEEASKSLADDIKQAQDRIKYIEQTEEREKQQQQLQHLIKLLYGPAYLMQQSQQMADNSLRISLSEKTDLYKKDKLISTAQDEKWTIEKKLKEKFYEALEDVGGLRTSIAVLKSDIDRCKGVETDASVDSELSMVLFEDYDLYRWQPNELKDSLLLLPSDTLMVSRLDGPSEKIVRGLIDKAVSAEKQGLTGNVYIDARGMNITGRFSEYSYEYYDKNLNQLSEMFKKRTKMKVVFENTASLFAPNACPQTAIYCGWYSVSKYIDAFDFVPGAIGYHIASFEAKDLRNAASTNWCPAMLVDGITATLGPVAEPYLHSFPLPVSFFSELLDGKCLAEAYYITNPYNSWRMVLIGDPLYKPRLN